MAANAAWLEDFALFMALKQAHGGKPWNTWEPALRARDAGAIASATARLADSIEEQKFLQHQFFTQWSALKRYANEHRIQIIGDAFRNKNVSGISATHHPLRHV